MRFPLTRPIAFSASLALLIALIEAESFQIPPSKKVTEDARSRYNEGKRMDDATFPPLARKGGKGGTELFETIDSEAVSDSTADFGEETPLTVANWTCPIEDKEEPPLAVAETLEGRLLCAAECAYEMSPPYYRSATFLPGLIVKRITRGVNSVLVGRTADGIVVSFRGTVANSPLDWLQNAELFLASPGDGIDGKVHIGFFRAIKALWKPLKAAIKAMVRFSGEPIYLTGHSKGGALASIAAVFIQRDADLPDPHYVCTFAAPKVGNADFARAFNVKIKQKSFEAYFDLIPLLPPSKDMMENMNDDMAAMVNDIMWSKGNRKDPPRYKYEYQPVGARRYINGNNCTVFPVTKELDDERIREIERATILSFKKFRAAHCSACPADNCDGRYFSGVASSVCANC